MMTYEEFNDMVCKEISSKMGNGTEVSVRTVHRANGVCYEGVAAYAGNAGIQSVYPVQEAYEAYKENPSAVQEIIHIIKKEMCRIPEGLQEMADAIRNGEDVKGRIFRRAVNYEKNREWLKNMPYKKIMDFAVTYYIGAGGECQNKYVVNIDNRLLAWLGVAEDELESLAGRNADRVQEPVIMPISEMIRKLMGSQGMDGMENNSNMEGADMYILSNRVNYLGAVCMFDKGILEKFSAMVQDDFYILPSSLHEVILKPKRGNGNWQELRQMVRDINENVLDAEDVLGDEVYLYERDLKHLHICA